MSAAMPEFDIASILSAPYLIGAMKKLPAIHLFDLPRQAVADFESRSLWVYVQAGQRYRLLPYCAEAEGIVKLSLEAFRAKYPEFTAVAGINRGLLEDETGISFRPACGDKIIVGVIRVGDQLNVFANGSPEYARLKFLAADLQMKYQTIAQ